MRFVPLDTTSGIATSSTSSSSSIGLGVTSHDRGQVRVTVEARFGDDQVHLWGADTAGAGVSRITEAKVTVRTMPVLARGGLPGCLLALSEVTEERGVETRTGLPTSRNRTGRSSSCTCCKRPDRRLQELPKSSDSLRGSLCGTVPPSQIRTQTHYKSNN